MHAPPSDLSRHFTHTAILATAGLTVKGIAPELTECPFCRHKTLTIYMDPVDVGPKWMHCATCQWAGNSLDAYCKIIEADVPTAIKQAIRDGICTGPEHIDKETIQNYIRGFPEHRSELWQIWTRLSENVSKVPRSKEVLRHLQKAGFWDGHEAQFQSLMARFMGAATKTELRKIFSICYARADQQFTSRLPEGKFDTALVLSYQDAPGRICAFELIDLTGERYLKVIPGRAGTTDEGGLALLDGIKPFTPTVVILDDPKVWLALHKRQCRQYEEPLPILLYNEKTNKAWRSITAIKSVFWTREITLDLFKHVRKVSNGCIVTGEWYYTDAGAASAFASGPIPLIFGELDRLARTWPEVFVEWVTHRDRPENEAIQAFNELEFTPGEKESIMSVATQTQRHKLENYIGASAHTRTTSVGGFNFIEQNNCWYIAKPKGNEQVLDGVIHVEEELCDAASVESYWRGVIKYRGHVIPFTNSAKEIARDPKAWLDRKTIAMNLGTPNYYPRFVEILPHIAKAFSTPRTRAISTKFGIQSDSTIVFPRFTVQNGEIQDNDNYCGSATLPMMAVMSPVRREADARDTTSLTRSLVVAAFCAMVANWIEVWCGRPTHPVAVVGNNGSIAWAAVQHLRIIFGLSQLSLAKKSYHVLSERLRQHNCPSMVERSAYLNGFSAACKDFIYLTTSEDETLGLRVSNVGWIIINSPQIRQETNPLPPVDDFLWYLADLQKRQFKLPGKKPLVAELIEDFCGWYEGYLDRDQTETAQQALEATQMADRPGQELLRLTVLGVRKGFLCIEHSPLDSVQTGQRHTKRSGISLKVGVVVDPLKGQVFIHEAAIMNVFNSYRLPVPDFNAATADLNAHKTILDGPTPGRGWIVPLEVWEAAQKAYLPLLK